jgi:hypothetical protein
MILKSTVCVTKIIAQFPIGFGNVTNITIDADSAGSFTANDLVNCTSPVYTIDSGGGAVAVTLPFTTNIGDILEISGTITNASLYAQITIR